MLLLANALQTVLECGPVISPFPSLPTALLPRLNPSEALLRMNITHFLTRIKKSPLNKNSCKIYLSGTSNE